MRVGRIRAVFEGVLGPERRAIPSPMDVKRLHLHGTKLIRKRRGETAQDSSGDMEERNLRISSVCRSER